ncbi:hypothetical protein BDR05DRAFT_955842 [Suillus weaverae]|nr:hypothetical protein BDR05DRAFT_955842 [Suillus weaverae]
MRSPIVLAVVVTLTALISARPADADVDSTSTELCPLLCMRQIDCQDCPATW